MRSLQTRYRMDLSKIDLEIYDTLRDGCQDPELNLNFEQKLQLVRLVSNISKDIPIEFSYAASDHDPEKIYSHVRDANIATFGSTYDPRKTFDTDPNIRKIKQAIKGGARAATIFGKTREIDIKDLKSDKKEYLEVIGNTVKRLLKTDGLDRVIYDAEHFFSGYDQDKEFALETLRKAKNSGADTLVLCNTKGGLLPFDVKDVIDDMGDIISQELKTARLGFHAHNDTDCAVANSDAFLMTASRYTDKLQIQGTWNGHGERSGNANLTSIIANTMLKRKIDLDLSLKDLTRFAKSYSDITGIPLNDKAAWVGKFAFSDKAGIHIYCQNNHGKDRYRHENPMLVGNISRNLMTSMSGNDHYQKIANNFGYNVKKNDRRIAKIQQRLKQMECRGYRIHASPAEHLLLIHDIFGERKLRIDLTYWMTNVQFDSDNLETERRSRTEIKGYLNSDGLVSLLDSEIESYMGPVDSQFSTLQQRLSKTYPYLSRVNLINFRVGITKREVKGSKSAVITYITFQDNGNTWTTQGVSNNILESTMEAIKKGFKYYVLVNEVYKEKNEDNWA